MIYIQNKNFKTVRELLQLMLSSDNISGAGKLATYYSKHCTVEQCAQNKNRSFTDLYELCKTYFPNVTKKRVFLELCTLYSKDNKKVYIKTCNTINNVRFGYIDKSINSGPLDFNWSSNIQLRVVKECFDVPVNVPTHVTLNDFLKIEIEKFKKTKYFKNAKT